MKLYEIQKKRYDTKLYTTKRSINFNHRMLLKDVYFSFLFKKILLTTENSISLPQYVKFQKIPLKFEKTYFFKFKKLFIISIIKQSYVIGDVRAHYTAWSKLCNIFYHREHTNGTTFCFYSNYYIV